jgi:hypothetical protein
MLATSFPVAFQRLDLQFSGTGGSNGNSLVRSPESSCRRGTPPDCNRGGFGKRQQLLGGRTKYAIITHNVARACDLAHCKIAGVALWPDGDCPDFRVNENVTVPFARRHAPTTSLTQKSAQAPRRDLETISTHPPSNMQSLYGERQSWRKRPPWIHHHPERQIAHGFALHIMGNDT